MTWTKLSTRLAQLPLLLAGPILRQVTPKAVTVWVALLKNAPVTLKVFDSADPGTILMTATRTTTAVGKNLYITAVTAQSQTALVPNKIYCYDLSFLDQAPVPTNLAQAVTPPGKALVSKPFAYGSQAFPSFALPPANLGQLRLIHGSCRKAHGGGILAPDALATLNMLIADDADDPIKRPHQLLLTGDQIYADEVAEPFLVMLTDAGDTLLGWAPAESIPGAVSDGPYLAANLPPSTRTHVIKDLAGFTSDDTRSHLMSLGEYLAMYLFAWSEVLWTDLPTINEFKNLFPNVSLSKQVQGDYAENFAALGVFLNTLPDVRRALANIPTYMICDDHEITDDWNMTLDFLNDVYGHPLGRRVVQNGLIAYSICQGWGNIPEQFADDPAQPAGLKLLKNMESVTQAANPAQQYNSLDQQLQQIVGVHDRSKLGTIGGAVHVFHDIADANETKLQGVTVSTSSLRYNFTVEGPAHQVIVTDTRTWRVLFPPGQSQTPGIPNIPHPDFLFDQLDAQFNKYPPDLKGRQLLVVFTTNAPPIATIRLLDRLTVSMDMIVKYDLFDCWEFPSRAYDRMIVAVTNKLPMVGDTLTGSVVFLSGDVHFSFSSRLAYWAEIQRLGDPTNKPQKAKLVVGQLVASSFKNEAEKTRGEQTSGYTYMPPDVEAWVKGIGVAVPLVGITVGSAGGLAPPHAPEAYVGWNIPLGTGKTKVGRLKAGWIQSGDTLYVSGLKPTQPTNLNYLTNVTLSQKPDYRYRLDFLTTVQTGQTASAPPNSLPTSSSDPTGAARSHSQAATAHRDLIDKGATPPDCIGFNSIGEIAFVTSQSSRHVQHTLRWQEPKKPQPFWAMYDVSLDVDDDLDDRAYPKIKAGSGEP